MADRSFLDTNVFVYLADSSDPDRQRQAEEIVLGTPGIVVSTQVLNEFYVVTTRKLTPPVPPPVAAATVTAMARYVCVSVDADLVQQAVRSGQRWQLSHWDALMIEAARQAGCERVLTEDLADGASYDGVQVQNPFR